MEINNNNLFGAEPPKDARGKTIPFNVETLYDLTIGEVVCIDSFRYLPNEKKWIISTYYEPLGKYNAGYSDVSFLLEPDSWDKLIKDLKSAANSLNPVCIYLNPEDKKCSECNLSLAEDCYNKAFLDIVTRIETLRGKSDD